MRVSSSTLHLQPGLVPTLKYVFHTAQVILPRARFSSSMSFRGVFCLSPNVKLTTLSSSGARELVSESGAALSVHALLRLRTLLFAGLTEFSSIVFSSFCSESVGLAWASSSSSSSLKFEATNSSPVPENLTSPWHHLVRKGLWQ